MTYFSDDEIFAFIISIVSVIGFYGFSYYRHLIKIFMTSKALKNLFIILPLIYFLGNFYTITVAASFDVVTDFSYIIFYSIMSLAFLALFFLLSSLFFGVSWLEDGLRNRNVASGLFMVGVAATCFGIYCGSNVGDGPSWLCVVFPTLLGLGVFIGSLLVANLFTKLFKNITVERDIAVGIRFLGFSIGSAIILFRACGGDWTSVSATIVEFFECWLYFVLVLVYMASEILFNFARRKSYFSYKVNVMSLIVGVIYIVLGIIAVIMIGPFHQNPMYP